MHSKFKNFRFRFAGSTEPEVLNEIAQIKNDINLSMEPFVDSVVNTIKSDCHIDGEPGMDPRYSEDQYRSTAEWMLSRFDQFLDKIWPQHTCDSKSECAVDCDRTVKKTPLQLLSPSFQALVDSSRLHTASVQKMNSILALYCENVASGSRKKSSRNFDARMQKIIHIKIMFFFVKIKNLVQN